MHNQQAAVFAGGGSKVAFIWGAIAGIFRDRVHHFNPRFFSGTSSGALLAAMLCQAGESRADLARELSAFGDVLQGITGDDSLSKKRFLWPLLAYFKKSTRQTKPLRDLIYTHIDHERIKASPRFCTVPAYRLASRETEYFSKSEPRFLDCVYASASFPIYFPPVWIEDALYSDGGVQEMVPVRGVLPWRPQEIFVFLTGSLSKPFDTEINNLKDIATSVIEGAFLQVAEGDLRPLIRYQSQNPLAKIWVINNSGLERFDSMSFDPKAIRSMMALGYRTKPVPLREYLLRENGFFDEE